jgi:DNA polymerase-4
MIVYLRVLPGFSIAAEERQRPELRSSPAIVGGLPHQRGIVREVNTLAARYGVRAGMTLSQARHYCPDGIFLVPDLPHYQMLWEEMCDILRDYTPLVEPVEMGQAACDLSGCARRWGTVTEAAHAIVTQMQRQVGITPCLGVASNWLVAQLASTGAGGDAVTVVETGQERSFLDPLPFTLLPDVDARLALTFSVLGLRTIGQFAALPATAVEQRFGAAGKKLHRYARGIDARPVSPPPPKPAVTARYECEEGSLEEASAALHRLAETCADELQHRHLMGKLVTLKLQWQESQTAPQPAEIDAVGVNCIHPEVTPAGRYPIHPPLPAEPDPSLPISYRIHSMLPQPGILSSRGENRRQRTQPAAVAIEEETRIVARPTVAAQSLYTNIIATSTLLRTPIDAAPPLLEHAQRLLLQLCSKSHFCETNPFCPQALELEVSEFEAPRQMAFPQLMRLDQTGSLGGGVADPRGVLTRQEQMLTARYGQQLFQHAGQFDPDSILTERRFRWQDGLPWNSSSGRPQRSGPPGGKSRTSASGESRTGSPGKHP